jgi:hypothetical protein
MSKIIVSTAMLVGLALPLSVSATADAAQPVVRGCVGSTLSGAAHAIAPFGGFVSGYARDRESRPGVSDNVHTIAAGGYTDDDFPNTCN